MIWGSRKSLEERVLEHTSGRDARRGSHGETRMKARMMRPGDGDGVIRTGTGIGVGAGTETELKIERDGRRRNVGSESVIVGGIKSRSGFHSLVHL
jgi:hypothetical protein